MASFLTETLSIEGKSLRKKLSIISFLVFVLPFLVFSYILYNEEILTKAAYYYACVYILLLVLSGAGLFILRQIFDKFILIALFAKKVEAGEMMIMDLHENTAELHELTVSFNNIIGTLEETSHRLEEQTVRLEQSRMECHRMDGALKETNKMLQTLIHALPDYVYFADAPGRFLMANKTFEEFVGLNQSEILGKSSKELFPPDLAEHIQNSDDEVRITHKPVHAEGQFIGKNGETIFLDTIKVPIHDDQGDIRWLLGVSRDITERKQLDKKLKQLAYYDPLTTLPNRILLLDRLRQAIFEGQHQGKSVGLLLMDLDHFKEINDTLGHHRGDVLLQQVGLHLQNSLWETDMVARLGGDEFAVILTLSESGHATLVANKIQKVLEQPFVIEGLPIAVEASIGIALYPDHGSNPESLMQRADVAMYAAKQTGSGCVIYDPKHDQHSPRRLALMGELRQAIENNLLRLHYQPKVSLKTGDVIGAEGLIRWQHPEFGSVPPDQFIAPAERTGLIKPLTRWVFSEALRQYRAWQQAGMDIIISINLSTRNLHDPHLPDQFSELLGIHGGGGDRIELEITESAIMVNPGRALETITKLKAMGMRFAIDDFGVGYSSLGYLKDLPVDTIKIDKSFVINLVKEDSTRAIVCSIIELSHNLGMNVVAEGVENKETLDHLSGLGCDAAQGYYISRPVPADEFGRWLTKSTLKLGSA